MVSGFTNTIWLVLIARIIPDNKLSNFLSIRASICGILEITGAYLSGIILSFGTFPNNYGVLFIIAFTILVVSYGFFSFTVEPRNVTKKPIQMDSRDYFKKLKQILKRDKNFLVYLLSTAFVGGFGKMSLMFQVIYAKEKLAISTREVALVSTVLFITQTCGYIMWGIVVKRKGLKIAGTLSGIMFIPAILLTLWMPNMAVLLIAVMFMSFAQSYRNSNENKLVINLAPDEGSLPSYIGLRNSLLGPFFSLNSLLAGFLLDISSFTVLTVISLVFMISGMLLFAVKLKVPEV
jgi:MFS family permease